MSKKQIPIRCEHTELVSPKKLKDHPKNPNRHPQNQIDALAGNIQAFGWRHPIIVSKRSGFIVAGHGRRDAAIQLGCKAPIDYQDFTSDEEEISVLIADNVIPELSHMDAMLLDENKELIAAAGFDLEIIGFEAPVEPDNPFDEWKDMPDYGNEPRAFRSITVHLQDEKAFADFQKMVNQGIGEKTKYIYIPPKEKENLKDLAWEESQDEEPAEEE